MAFDAGIPDRSARREVRNPVLSLPAAKALMALPADQRKVIDQLLKELAQDADAKADKAWAKRKGPMAAYWRATSTYAKHIRAVVRKGR